MNTSTLLQLFLLLDIFFIGMLVAVAVQHAYAHFKSPKHEPEAAHTPPNDHLPAQVKERLVRASETQFQTALNHSATKFLHDLEATSSQMNKLVGQLGTEIIGDELERYHKELTQLRKQAETGMGNISKEIAQHQDELKSQLDQEMAAEKQRLLKQIDTKLADAVGSFLLETLQHNIDLGAQSPYLIEILKEHKADFMREIVDEA